MKGNKEVLRLRTIIGIAVLLASSLAMASAPLPADANIADVTKDPYFAKGDGVTDDTKAIVTAIQDGISWNSRYHRQKIIYLPKGTYRVTDSLWARLDPTSWSKGWRAGSVVMGEGVDETIIKLDDNLPKFGDPENPMPLFKTGSEEKSHNRAFRHYFHHFTVDIGKGNPGAIGISYLVSNRGSINNVRVRSSDPNYAGHTGIEMYAGSGPGMLNDVEIIGFDYGIRVWGTMLGTTMEGVTVKHQNVFGLYNEKNSVHLRKFYSENSVTAIKTGSALAHTVIVDAEARGINPESYSAAYDCVGGAVLYNVKSSGYTVPLRTAYGNQYNENIVEYVSHPAYSLFGSETNLLMLDIEETPYYHPSDMSKWTNVVDHGATPTDTDDDDADAIQSAIDASDGVVYLPQGKYTIGKTVVIRGNVKKIMGCCAQVTGACDPVFRFANGNAPFTIIQHIRLRGEGNIVHDANRDLVLKNMDLTNYRNTKNGTGKLFMEDVIGSEFTINKPQKVWARQYNSEGNTLRIHNNGGTFWALGYKTEGYGTVLKTTNGGHSEVLGAVIYPATNKQDIVPDAAFIVNNSRFAASYIEITSDWEQAFPIHVEETQGGSTKELARSDELSRGGGRMVPLYSNYNNPKAPIVQQAFDALSSQQIDGRTLLINTLGRSLPLPLTRSIDSPVGLQNQPKGLIIRVLKDERRGSLEGAKKQMLLP